MNRQGDRGRQDGGLLRRILSRGQNEEGDGEMARSGGTGDGCVVEHVLRIGSGWLLSRCDERPGDSGTRAFQNCSDIVPIRPVMFQYVSVFVVEMRQTRGKRESGRENGEFRVAGAKCLETKPEVRHQRSDVRGQRSDQARPCWLLRRESPIIVTVVRVVRAAGEGPTSLGLVLFALQGVCP
jgi:hypothetical protein